LPDTTAPLIEADAISVAFPRRREAFWKPVPAPFVAVDGVSLSIRPGETLGLVGESGSGKSTIGRALLRKHAVSSGTIRFRGEDITHLRGKGLKAMRRNMQPVFQDPYATLNPRMSIGEIIAEPLVVHRLAKGSELRERVAELLRLVGLSPDFVDRAPQGFSGGQRQRIGIARALALSPQLIIADEPISALDVSIRAQIVNLFKDLQDRLGVAFLFIAHDLAIVRHISHRIVILYAGRIMEEGTSAQIFQAPRHPYTRALIASIPVPDPTRRDERPSPIRGELVIMRNAVGCSFAPRCPLATDICREQTPQLRGADGQTRVACWHAN
jgi:oligopeptide/dipeptide ABC transporter ATP-binding protein